MFASSSEAIATFRDREEPAFWREAVEKAVERRRPILEEVWHVAQDERSDASEREIAARKKLEPALAGICRDLLAGMHPEVSHLL